MAGCKVRAHDLSTASLTSVLLPEEHCPAFTGTKLVATIGPACNTVDVLADLLHAGLSGARVDLTWGSLDFHRASLQNLQEAMRKAQRLCATMVDTLGRELMIRRQGVRIDESGWPVHEETFSIKSGDRVTITTRPDVQASASVLPITYPEFTEMAERGDTIYVGRYLVSGADSASLFLEVDEVVGPDVLCVAKNDAVLSGLLTVFHAERSFDTVANVQNDLPLLSDYDKEAIKVIASEFEIDFISLSYTRSAEDVVEARRYLQSIGCDKTRILAKIETRQSLLNFKGILKEADGIIMSRGNLGLDCVPEKMALVQKGMCQACNLVGKPLLITRVVDTMATTPRPTRAEATDIANAVLDGVDGILLGAETLRGKHPLETVCTVARIARSAEAVFDHDGHFDHLMELALEREEAEEEEAARAAALASVNEDDDNGDESLHSGSSAVGLDGQGPGAALEDGMLTPSGPARTMASSSASSLHNGHNGHVSNGVPEGKPPRPRVGSLSALNKYDGSAHGGKTYKPSLLGTPPLSARGTSLEQRELETSPVAARLPTPQLAGKGLSSVKKLGGSSVYASMACLSNMPPIVRTHGLWRSPYLSKLESIASSAVRVADKMTARLIFVFTHTGMTAALVAKYKPPVPVMALVVPTLRSDGLTWQLEGRGYARQTLLTRGTYPLLCAPNASGEQMLEDAVASAFRMKMVGPGDHIVCVERTGDGDCCVKIIRVSSSGSTIEQLEPLSQGARLATTMPRPLMAAVGAGKSALEAPGDDDYAFDLRHMP